MVAVTGTGSGLDIDGLVASLVAAEQVPAEARLNAREASITSLSTSFSSAKSAVLILSRLRINSLSQAPFLNSPLRQATQPRRLFQQRVRPR